LPKNCQKNFSIEIFKNIFIFQNYQFVYQSSFSSICPTKQLKRLCVDSINNSPIISKSSPECSRFSYRPIKERNYQNNLNLSSFGLDGNNNNNKTGIFSLVDLFVKTNNIGDNNVGFFFIITVQC
jgi:hypothetical protein